MRRIFYLLFLYLLNTNLSFAQNAIVRHVVGGSAANGYAGDGLMATDPAVRFNGTNGVAIDAAGNLYVADYTNNRVRRMDATTGILSTIAGTGTLGYSGDGGLAVNAGIAKPQGVFVDGYGNIYFSQGSNPAIRKVDVNTGKISTVAGTGVSGNTGDGGPATSAKLQAGSSVYVDAAGNIFITDGNRVRRVDAITGIINAFAGTTTAGFDGDGGPATAAKLSSPSSITGDASGNIYILDKTNVRIRKVDPAGVINTIAGTGAGGYTGDGSSAVTASLSSPKCISSDVVGNIYLADQTGKVIRKIDAGTGAISTVAGTTAYYPGVHDLAIGASADSTQLAVSYLCTDVSGNLYYSDGSGWVNWVAYSYQTAAVYTHDFWASATNTCSGPQIGLYVFNNVQATSLTTYFGDNQSITTPVITGPNITYVNLGHVYQCSGTYSIKHVLYNGAVAIDSVKYSYQHILCADMSIQFYKDLDNNCVKDSSEPPSMSSFVVKVSRNNIVVDTIATTSGFYYKAYGDPGDVYTFKVISTLPQMKVACPANGEMSNVLLANNNPVNYFGVQCVATNNFDLAVHAVIPVTGTIDQWGKIYVQNNGCQATNATVKLHYSPKYAGVPSQVTPQAALVAGNSIEWNLNAVSAIDDVPRNLHYAIWKGPTALTIGDTVISHIEVTPTTGDTDVTNNVVIETDTVKASCDPNLIAVKPEGNILAGTLLRYLIEFENVGNDTAHNIYVLDTLPNEVEIRSLRVLWASNVMYSTRLSDGVHNIIKWDFPNINLLDSSHHGECIGMFEYTVEAGHYLPFGTNIDHRVGIYFDDNGLVMTNTVRNTIAWPAEVVNVSNGDKLQIYPNPTKNELSVSMQGEPMSSVLITNVLGQEVYKNNNEKKELRVDVSGLKSGVYFVKVNGLHAQKFIKE